MTSKNKQAYALADLVQGLDVTIQGDPACLITGVASIQQAQSGQVTFLTNALYRKFLATSAASAVIVNAADAPLCTNNVIISKNPHHTYAKIAAFFVNPSADVTPGVHPTAIIAAETNIDPTATIGPHCVIGRNAKIAAQVIVGAGTVIGDEAEIGEASHLHANVTICHQVKIGKRTTVASGAVIGSEGFGFALEQARWHKVPQLGSVQIGDDVDIGANTTIDRGAIDDTIIGNGVKLDNLIQIGHNVKIDDHTIIAGCVAIAGSTVIGKHCMIGGGTCFVGHITICDYAIITGMSAVTKSIATPGMYSSGIVGVVPTPEFRKNNARFHRLENLMQRVKHLESALKVLTERKTS